MSGNITVDMSEAREYLEKLDDAVSESLIEKALTAESEILALRMAKESPRLPYDRKWKNRTRKHMQDDMKISPLMVASNGAYLMASGPQIKPASPSYRGSDGHAYAPLVNYGTSRIRANDFMGRTEDAVGDQAIEAAMDALRKGLGIGG